MAKPIAKKSKWVPEEVKSAYEEFRLDPGVLSGLGLAFSPLEATGNAAGDFVFDNTSGLPVPLRAGLSTAGYMLGSGALGTGPFTGSAKYLARGAKRLAPEIANLAEKYAEHNANIKIPAGLRSQAGVIKLPNGNWLYGKGGDSNLAEKYRLAHELAQKNAALSVSKGGLGLPPDNTALDRAKALGFDIYNKYFHGTGDDFTEFDPNSFFTSKPESASTYALDRGDTYAIDMHGDPRKAANVMPVYVKAKKYADDDAVISAAKKTKMYDPEIEDSYYYTSPNYDNFSAKAAPVVTAELKKKGYDAAKHYDFDMNGNEIISSQFFDPSQIRSTSAAFDPFRRGEADILAGVGIGLPVTGVVNRQEPVKKAGGGAVHMEQGGLWEGYGAPVDRDTQKRQSVYYPQQEQSVRVTPSGAYRESANGDVDISRYTMGADIDILNKYGFGVTKQGEVVKLPERSYTFDDGYTETQPARKIKHSDISELRATYTTDDGVQYGVVRQPLAKGWSGYRRNIKDNSSVGVSVSPHYTGVNYTKNFAEGGEVHPEFNFDEINNYAQGGIVAHNDFNYAEISKMADQLMGSMYG